MPQRTTSRFAWWSRPRWSSQSRQLLCTSHAPSRATRTRRRPRPSPRSRFVASLLLLVTGHRHRDGERRSLTVVARILVQLDEVVGREGGGPVRAAALGGNQEGSRSGDRDRTYR